MDTIEHHHAECAGLKEAGAAPSNSCTWVVYDPLRKTYRQPNINSQLEFIQVTFDRYRKYSPKSIINMAEYREVQDLIEPFMVNGIRHHNTILAAREVESDDGVHLKSMERRQQILDATRERSYLNWVGVLGLSGMVAAGFTAGGGYVLPPIFAIASYALYKVARRGYVSHAYLDDASLRVSDNHRRRALPLRDEDPSYAAEGRRDRFALERLWLKQKEEGAVTTISKGATRILLAHLRSKLNDSDKRNRST